MFVDSTAGLSFLKASEDSNTVKPSISCWLDEDRECKARAFYFIHSKQMAKGLAISLVKSLIASHVHVGPAKHEPLQYSGSSQQVTVPSDRSTHNLPLAESHSAKWTMWGSHKPDCEVKDTSFKASPYFICPVLKKSSVRLWHSPADLHVCGGMRLNDDSSLIV